MGEKADDGRERVGSTGRITPKGDVRNGLFEQVVGDLLGDLHVVLLAELEEVLFSTVGELEASPLSVVDQFPGFRLERVHRLVIEARVVAVRVGIRAPEGRIPGYVVYALEPGICATSSRPFR